MINIMQTSVNSVRLRICN